MIFKIGKQRTPIMVLIIIKYRSFGWSFKGIILVCSSIIWLYLFTIKSILCPNLLKLRRLPTFPMRSFHIILFVTQMPSLNFPQAFSSFVMPYSKNNSLFHKKTEFYKQDKQFHKLRGIPALLKENIFLFIFWWYICQKIMLLFFWNLQLLLWV